LTRRSRTAGLAFSFKWVYNGYITIDRVETGDCPFLLYSKEIMRQKTNKKTKSKNQDKSKKQKDLFFVLGDIDPQKGRILFLILAIIFVVTGMSISYLFNLNKNSIAQLTDAQIKSIILEKEINKLVNGYPIESMTPFIMQKDPKIAAFLVSIAKKESNWGKNRPVLAGKDCYNYWGFRLKTDSMGSSGHTCFDSPKEAVDTVAARLNEMVNEEKIDSPKEMVVWKCGYGCQDEIKTPSEQKWIRDVSYYYNELANYL
jgi:hypothetical protein